MKNNILFLLLVLLLAGCYEDETTNATGAISEITIDPTSVQGEYNISKNDILVIKPVVSQTMPKKQLTLTWEIGDENYTGEVLEYKAVSLGTFRCRLIVQNEDGRAFLPFVINVNTPYEEGITVLSVDPQGKTRLSFMLHQVDGVTADYFYKDDCYATNNSDEEALAPGGCDLALCNGNLLICCKGDKQYGGTIYYIDEKTFVVENIVTAKEYDNFHPTLMGVPHNVYPGTAFPLINEDGTAYYFSPEEGALTPSAKFPHRYAQRMIVTGRAGGFYDLYMWDETIGGLCSMLNAYGPYYCSQAFHCQLKPDEKGGYKLTDDNYFENNKFEGMVMAQPYVKTDEAQLIVFTRPNGGRLCRTILHYGWWVTDNLLSDNGGQRSVALMPATSLSAQTPMVATMRYGTMLFADGNKVCKWVYTSGQYIEQAKGKPIATVGTGNAVITCLTLSPDHSETYIAYYEPDEADMNGHVVVIDTDKGTILRQYDNVCYRPTRVIYKTK